MHACPGSKAKIEGLQEGETYYQFAGNVDAVRAVIQYIYTGVIDISCDVLILINKWGLKI